MATTLPSAGSYGDSICCKASPTRPSAFAPNAEGHDALLDICEVCTNACSVQRRTDRERIRRTRGVLILGITNGAVFAGLNQVSLLSREAFLGLLVRF